MLGTLILSLICTNSPVSGLIFSFVPGGNVIRNVINPFLNILNTTYGNGNPTITANAVRLFDPILAMQFGQDDLVSSPEDYQKLPHPYSLSSRNSLELDQVGDSRHPPSSRHFGLFPPWADHPNLAPLPKDPMEFIPYDYRDPYGLFPPDYNLNDYLYAANEYPLGLMHNPPYDLLARDDSESNSQSVDVVSTNVANSMFGNPETVMNPMSTIYRSPTIIDSSGSSFKASDPSSSNTPMNNEYLAYPLNPAYFSRYGPFVRDYVSSTISPDAAQWKTEKLFEDRDTERKDLKSQVLGLKNYPFISGYLDPNQVSIEREVMSTELEREPSSPTYVHTYDPIFAKNILSGPGLGLRDKLSSLTNILNNQGLNDHPLRHWLEGSNQEKYPWPSNSLGNLGQDNNPFNQNYQQKYTPFFSNMMGSNFLLKENLLNPVNRLEDALNQIPEETKSRLPFNIPYGTNNINYGIVEPNFGNYPIYSFDNKNPIQNFNHQTNPSFNTVETPPKVPTKIPSSWSLIQKPDNIVSPIAPKDNTKSLFTPNDLFSPGKYSEEEIKYLQNLPKTPLACPPVAPTNIGYNADGIRTDWPADPKSLSREASDDSSAGDPQKIDLPTQTEKPIPALIMLPKSNQPENFEDPAPAPKSIPALVMIPKSDQPEDFEDPTLKTIMSNVTYNFLPIQLPESFLNNLISNGLFSTLFDNFPKGDIITTAANPRSYTLLNPKKHGIQLYDPGLRGYHGSINPFSQQHKGIGYRRPRIR